MTLEFLAGQSGLALEASFIFVGWGGMVFGGGEGSSVADAWMETGIHRWIMFPNRSRECTLILV